MQIQGFILHWGLEKTIPDFVSWDLSIWGFYVCIFEEVSPTEKIYEYIWDRYLIISKRNSLATYYPIETAKK